MLPYKADRMEKFCTSVQFLLMLARFYYLYKRDEGEKNNK